MKRDYQFTTEAEAINYIFRTRRRLSGLMRPRGLDEHSRDPSITRQLLDMVGLLDKSTVEVNPKTPSQPPPISGEVDIQKIVSNIHLPVDRGIERDREKSSVPREYIVVTGSKGKGSTTAITAKLLQHLGHTVGMITSPHMVSWYERIRVNGRMIPQADFLRILGDLEPHITALEATLTEEQYFSPQGIFLAMALQWFNEQQVDVAVLEVGRGGRFDDVAVVPNACSLFTPMILEHTQYLGDSLERIAWHKAGIIKKNSHAFTVAQHKDALKVLRIEADMQNATLTTLEAENSAHYIGNSANGIQLQHPTLGKVELSLKGKYQAENASLAILGAEYIHQRLRYASADNMNQQFDEVSKEKINFEFHPPVYGGTEGGKNLTSFDNMNQQLKNGLADVRWHGRVQKLQDNPTIYIDGATNPKTAQIFLESIQAEIIKPTVMIIGVPADRDYEGVYRVLAPYADAMILMHNDINPNITFPEPALAIHTAQQFHDDVQYADNLAEATQLAEKITGKAGTILIAAAQPIVGEAFLYWENDFGVI